MIFPVIPCPDKRETSLAAWPLVTNYNPPAMEETYFLSEREGEETSKEKEGKPKTPDGQSEHFRAEPAGVFQGCGPIRCNTLFSSGVSMEFCPALGFSPD